MRTEPESTAFDPETGFVPSSTTARTFRDALGRFATGVTVVTARGPAGPVGITANSFASLSLDPALVIWSPARASRRFPIFAEAEAYAIHILAEDQQALARQFAGSGLDFDWRTATDGHGGAPLLPGCLARFQCRRVALHAGGDHAIVVGEVVRADWSRGEPLVFFAGGYGQLAASAD